MLQQPMKLLGAGGFGKVYLDGDGNAVKVFKNNVTVFEAAKECAAHENIHKMYKEFATKNPEFGKMIWVPSVVRPFEPQTMSYTMECVSSMRQDGLLQHIILSEDYQPYTGLIHCVNGDPIKNTNHMSDAEIGEKCPRGDFIGNSHITDISFDPSILVTLMGILYQLCYQARYAPKDVEYVLDKSKRLCMIDFGMVSEEYTDMDIDIDMYVPQSTSNLYNSFCKGRSIVQLTT